MPPPGDEAAGDERILVFAPTGRDAALAGGVLEREGFGWTACPSIETLCSEIERGAGATLLAEEALTPDVLSRLAPVLNQQPAWSDLPTLVLLHVERRGNPTPEIGRLTESLGNITFLHRPVSIASLLSAVRTALRARRRQYQMRELMDELQRAVRARESFVASVSHELRTPLNVIIGRTSLLGRVLPDDNQCAPYVETIDRNARILWHLVDDLIEIARASTGQFALQLADVDFAAIVRTAVEGLRPTAVAKGVMVVDTIAADLHVHGDAVRLQQVVSNVVWNAVKFTPGGGRVVVALTGDDSRAVLTVTDTGIGMSPELLPHIFEPFRQGSASATAEGQAHRGLGLGLSIVRHLVQAHGGDITAISDGEGRGAAFVVRLPRLHAASCPSEA